MFRVGQRLGKYRLRRRLARGGFSDVFDAYDTIEKRNVALKVPRQKDDEDFQYGFDREIQTAVRLAHPNILPLKNADRIDGVLTLAYPLGERSLADRLTHRMGVPTALDYGSQVLAGLAHAHANKVIHCDIKPGNMILFADDTLCLSDFGLAKQFIRTRAASSSGTLGYMAPEQAMGHPSARSDVFSAGLIIYRMITGVLPEWPYEWPLLGNDRLRRRAPELVEFLRRALALSSRQRYREAVQMREHYEPVRLKTLQRIEKQRRARQRK